MRGGLTTNTLCGVFTKSESFNARGANMLLTAEDQAILEAKPDGFDLDEAFQTFVRSLPEKYRAYLRSPA